MLEPSPRINLGPAGCPKMVEPTESTPIKVRPGQASRSTEAVPAEWPPVPTDATRTSTLPS